MLFCYRFRARFSTGSRDTGRSVGFAHGGYEFWAEEYMRDQASEELPSRSSEISIHPLSDALGAEIRGVDASREYIEDFELILRAWREHLVLLIRVQQISAADQIHFAQRFGQVEPRTSKSEQEVLADA